jgi:hypothetical protein
MGEGPPETLRQFGRRKIVLAWEAVAVKYTAAFGVH